MCNLAAYIGDQPAVPILLDLLDAQEGLAGGYFTGIATIHEGQLHYRKVVGCLADLLAETDAAKLPGTCGIIHSRSKGFGGVECAHPFVNPDENLALVLNGHTGMYGDTQKTAAIITELQQNNYKFDTFTSDIIPGMAHLPDGSGTIHASQLFCMLLDHIHKNKADIFASLQASAQRLPKEVVGLLLHAESPDCVYAWRVNQPLMIARSAKATWLSTCALAFPEGMEVIMPAPIRSLMRFTAQGFEVKPIREGKLPVANIFPFAEGYQAMVNALQEKDCGIQDLKDASAALWPEKMSPQKDMMVYEIVRLLLHEQKVTLQKELVPGLKEGQWVPYRKVVWK